MNSDGSIVVVSHPSGSSGAGRAGVFQSINDGESMSWVQMGSDIIGVCGDFGYRRCVSITYDGMTVRGGPVTKTRVIKKYINNYINTWKFHVFMSLFM